MSIYIFTFKNIINGLNDTKWPCRMESIKHGKLFESLPKGSEIYLDGAHNVSGARVVANFLKSQKGKFGLNNYIINGRTKNTDSHGFIKEFLGVVDFFLAVRVKMEAIPESEYKIALSAKEIGIRSATASSLMNAIEQIIKYEEEVSQKTNPVRICICGSLYLARDVRVESSAD